MRVTDQLYSSRRGPVVWTGVATILAGSIFSSPLVCADPASGCRKGDRMEVRLDGRPVKSSGRIDPASKMDLDYVFGIGLQGDWSIDVKNDEMRLHLGTDSRVLDDA